MILTATENVLQKFVGVFQPLLLPEDASPNSLEL
jgi:hypothetical protein